MCLDQLACYDVTERLVKVGGDEVYCNQAYPHQPTAGMDRPLRT